ncbi:MAG TPA: universal stress protein [Puia sp.]|nr:universal stress protein [Puia sp.]
MLKILIPTDLSRESRSGMRFAIQWAKQQKARLIFFHAACIPGLTRWSDKQYQSYRTAELDMRQRRLRQLVGDVVARAGGWPQHYECIIVEGISPETILQDYCRKHKDIDLICMGTHGAAGVQRLWGTHSGNMITHSPTPVVVVPKGYRAKAIRQLLYASDLNNYEEELKKIVPLVRHLKAALHIFHLVGPDERVPDRVLFENVIKQEFHMECPIHLVIMDETMSLAANLHKFIQKMKPSLVAMFTDQQRTLFEKIFYPSRTEKYAFRTHAPLLTFSKR